jgi:hypothetical protein
MEKILTFDQTLKKSVNTQRNLLLGNGFSIACDPNIFNYESLYFEAEENIRKEMPEVHEIFKKLGTKDFELVIKMLQNAKEILPHYLPLNKKTASKMGQHAEQLKDILITTIANNHPEYPASISNSKFDSCRSFLANYIHSAVDGRVYTLNYDLLLYWTLMHEEKDSTGYIELYKNDGFGKDDPEDDYIIWVNEAHTRDQRVFYLHGAIHLFDNGPDLEKYTWINTGKRLIEQAREALDEGKFPLFVAEGLSPHKAKKIRHHPYLHHCYKSFISICKEGKGARGVKKSLFIFGHSFSDNDDHIIKQISKGSISAVYVSIYGDPNTKENKEIIRKAKNLISQRREYNPLEVFLYDAESAEVWG